MPEIIPNLHPIFVHFTVALISVSVAVFAVLYVFKERLPDKLREQWRAVAHWNLWLGATITLVTVAAGFYAFNTVRHDELSHAAMTVHRNWALLTVLLIVSMALWSILRVLEGKPFGALFVGGLLITQSLLLTTAWHGGELVYRHGLGVMSLSQKMGAVPGQEQAGGHDHGGTGMDMEGMNMEGMDMEGMDMPNDDGHKHQH